MKPSKNFIDLTPPKSEKAKAKEILDTKLKKMCLTKIAYESSALAYQAYYDRNKNTPLFKVHLVRSYKCPNCKKWHLTRKQ